MKLKIENRTAAVIVALVGMWFIGSAGIYLAFRSGEWLFFAPGGYDISTLEQLGGFFLARFGAQIPAAAFVAFIISLANFRRPLRVAFCIAFGLQSFLLGLRAVRWPWTQYPHLDQSIPILGELIDLSLITGCTVLFTWLVVQLSKRNSHR